MYRKTFTLLSGTDSIDDEKWYWGISLQINRHGLIRCDDIHARQNHAYYIRNQEKIKQQTKDWSGNNKELVAGYKEKWHAANPEKRKQVMSRSNKKQKAKRKGMGFKPLNEPFEGAEGHHVDNDQVIFMPSDIHQGMYHNLQTGQGMAEMNALAFQYLFKHT
jgi:hypothetical protein